MSYLLLCDMLTVCEHILCQGLTGTLFHALTLLLGGGSHKREQGDFEEYLARLIKFKEKNGHSNGKRRRAECT